VAECSQTKEVVSVTSSFNCITSGVIYLNTCERCKKQHIGQKGRKLREIWWGPVQQLSEKNGNRYTLHPNRLQTWKWRTLDRGSPPKHLMVWINMINSSVLLLTWNWCASIHPACVWICMRPQM
jgi:hypothetical protein